MALTSCMWTGVSGLLAHGEKMNVVGNNIANVSTIGFKGQRMDFADFVYQDNFSNNGLAQIGRGVKIGAIMQNFQTGPYESSTEATDLAINGRGFFKVNKIGQDQAYYTRAGNFRFNKDGYLIDPNGLALQGWKVDNSGGVKQAAGGMNLEAITEAKKSAIVGTGVPQDIKLDTWTVLPQQTTNITFKVNLPKEGADKATDQTNPFAGLLKAWDGTQPPPSTSTKPMPESAFDYSTTMEVYDEGGSKHKITIYYDKVDKNSYTGGDSSQEIWEYVVTMDPSEDQRQFLDTSTTPPTLKKMQETGMAGMLMTGTLTFNAAGNLVNQSSYTWGGGMTPDANPTAFRNIMDPADPLNDLSVIALDPEDLHNWYPAPISTSGQPMISPNFSGVLDAQTSGSTMGYKYNIEMDFGLKVGNFQMPWENQLSLGAIEDAILPYAYNSSYKAGNPATGPEFVLLNPDYDPTLNLLTDGPNAFQYMFNLSGPNALYPGTAGSATDQEWIQTLITYKGVNTTVHIPEGTIIDGTAVPAGGWDITIPVAHLQGAMNVDPTQTINGTDSGGTPVTFATGTPAWTDVENFVRNNLVTQVNTNNVADRSVLAAATAANANNIAEMSRPVIIDAHACTNFSGSFSASQAQDGYGYGDLSSWHVDQDGVLYGVYSNGVTLPLWQVTLYDFNCTQGLRREGNNLFSQTRQSGEHKFGAAGVSGLGSVNGYTLEQSNVDMSTEFVQMISTQRGFQANSKVITTTDTMLDTVINMKR